MRTHILRLTGPLVISFWLRSAFAWIDTFFAADLERLEQSPGLGDASVAAIGMALPLEFLSIACWVGASNGLTARLAATMGANEGEKVAQLKKAALAIIAGLVAIFLAMAAAVWFFSDAWISSPVLARQFQLYTTILIGGSAITSFWAILPDSIVKAHQDTRSTMWAGLLSSVVNVALNALFVYVFVWGIVGIALSTVLSRIASLAYAQRQANRHERARIASGRDSVVGRFDKPIRAILSLAIPGSVTYLLMSLESASVVAIIARFSDADATVSILAAWSIFDRMVRFMVMPGVACSVALLPLAAKFAGARDFLQVRAELHVAERACALYSLLFVTPFAVLVGPLLVNYLSKSEATRALATTGMYWVPLAVAASLPFFLARSTFDGLQKPRPGLLASMLRTLVLFIPAVAGGLYLAQRLEWSAMHGLCAGGSLAFIGGSLLLRKWMSRHLQEVAARAVAVETAN